MKVSREQVAQNRLKILEAAGRLFREHGYESVSVAQVMKAAGMTHGGFYGYFASKDELVVEALAYVATTSPAVGGDLAGYIERYLSGPHRDDCAGGCPLAGLAAETRRQSDEARAQMTRSIAGQLERLAQDMPGDSAEAVRRAATGSLATMVGALVLARVCDNPQLAAQLLDDSRDWLLEKNRLG
ncbi:TetR/AcrR family transcriptional regulator [Pseudomonas vanderleydeniana]|uniref:TetR/AcrR family transcriptional regulator n=1 Tax=Pseudomonas vanderleydeniana TaxID=2745495 RepID=A0A9E6TQ12_9PSED|nr:TetR/AcrR family transcriptional regulator [Pseudomonas vanderleydeniana]QXI25962.1 TetR/AcrR family transcriptional regulator [Pseudomonas vanderleydeniana]